MSEAKSESSKYNVQYLTKAMGLSVQRGRGPAWHRAKALMEKFGVTHWEDASRPLPSGDAPA